MNGKKWGLALVLLLLLVGGAGAYYVFRTDPNLAKALDLQKQMQNKDLTDEQRRALWGEMRQTFETLTPEQMQQLRRNRGPDRWAAKQQEDMKKYFAMSAKDKRKFLDQQIDDMLKRRKEREKQRQQQLQNAQANSNTGNNNNNNGQGGRGQGGPGGGNSGDRSQQQRLRLDNSSPAQRADSYAFQRDMVTRMQQRGIPPGGGGFGGGGGRRGF
jgi:hypothetical protein